MIITCPSCSARYVVDPAKIGPDGRTVKCAKCGNAWAQPAPTPEEMADAVAEPQAQPAPAAPPPDTPAPDAPPPETTGEAPAASDVASAFEDRIGREPAAPDDDDVADSFDGGTDDDFRASFDDAISRDPEPVARPLRGGKSANLPAVQGKSSRWPARIAWLALILVVVGVIGGGIAFQTTISKSWPPAQKLYDMIGLTPEPIKKRLGVRSVRYTYPDKTTLRIDGELVNLSKAPHDVPNLRILFLDETGKVVKRWTFPPPERRMLPDEVVKFATEIKNPPANAKRIDVGVDEK